MCLETMKVVMFFLESSDMVLRAIWGRYCGGGLIFVEGSTRDMFTTTPLSNFRKWEFSDSTVKKWNDDSITIHFLQIHVDEEETQKMRATCDACVEVRKRFNMTDTLLKWIPFRDPSELSIVEVKQFTNEQAMILILRDGLKPDNPIQAGLSDLNSRTTFMYTLYDRLALYATPLFWCSLANL